MAQAPDILGFINQQKQGRTQALQNLGNSVAGILQQKAQKDKLAQTKADQLQAANWLGQASSIGGEEGQKLYAKAAALAPRFVGLLTENRRAQAREADDTERRNIRRLELEARKEQLRLSGIKKGLDIEGSKQNIKIREKKLADASNPVKNASEGQKKAANFARRMVDSATELESLEQLIDPTARSIALISGGGGFTSEVANRVASDDEQLYASAASDFVTAQLRRESGAAIGADEFERKYREFFPVVGDSEKQIKSKANRRLKAANDMKVESGGLFESLQESSGEQVQEVAPQVAAPQGAIDYLKANPDFAGQFKAKFGYLPEGF